MTTIGGLDVRVVLDGAATHGAYAVVDVRAPAGTRLPPHVASREDDTVLVLDGELEVQLAEGRTLVTAGELFRLPRKAPRRICVLEDVHLLVVVVPAGLERLAGLASGPTPDADDLAALLSAAGVALLPRRWGEPPA